MEPQKLAMILYLIAIVLAATGVVLNLIGYGFIYGSVIFVYSPIILIALGLLLPIIMKK